MLRRSFLAFLNLAPLSFAAKWFPGSTIAAKGDLFRHKGWSITWTAYADSKTSLGYWMGVPISTETKKTRAPFRVLVSRIHWSRPIGRAKMVERGLARLDSLILTEALITKIAPAVTPPANYPHNVPGEIGASGKTPDGQSWMMTHDGWKPLPWVSTPEDPRVREERERKESERYDLSAQMVERGDFEGAAAIIGMDPVVLRDFYHPRASGSRR